MDFLPIFLNIRGRRCAVIGGGEVAARKVSLLLEAGGAVTVYSPKLCAALAELRDAGRLQHVAERFSEGMLDGCAIAIAATDDDAVNRQVSEAAIQRNVPVNVVDQPELCSFIVPSIVDRSPVVVAVSTGGASPVLARLIRARLETLIPTAYGRLAQLVESFRDKVKARFTHPPKRRVFWEDVLQGPVAELVFAGQEEAARIELEKKLSSVDGTGKPVGEVYLVGGGPGDPDLLTFRALRLMQQADVVVHDRLVSEEVLNLARRDAVRIYAGKERSHHAIPQEDINQLLVRLAKEGKRVVRLKGGDPFIFGRGGEEIETLAAEGIHFQVVPAVTAAAGCAAYSGIPLTHRDYAQSVVLVTGHLQDGTVNLNWKGLVQPDQTVVFYMGLQGVQTICRELIAHGMPDSTPAALVQQGTTRHQRVFTGTLATLPEIVERSKVKAPTLIIVGDVVRLRDKLKWFEPTGE
ncbi:MAG: sirohydrochlorin ferrochelatase [Acidithiobacillales bacterium SM23_46]|jgi:uroporphyrin-III C-methyltransferase/precorrin-2 dehydrogenase/sirohydrochlorin ferrochelatase|nr:MAG: sirohydrochlorin ferrochelatase [Acidithiobacillales bacterium SM23_46]